VALRLWLLPDLPLSQYQLSYNGESSQFWDVLIDVGFGSLADSLAQFPPTAALGRLADIGPGQILRYFTAACGQNQPLQTL
jgi:hypothetical protein